MRCTPSKELHWFHPEAFCLEVSEQDLKRIFISFPGMSPQVLISTDWSVPGRGSLAIAAGPDVTETVSWKSKCHFQGLIMKASSFDHC